MADQLKMYRLQMRLRSPGWRHGDDTAFQIDGYIGYITQLRDVLQFEFIKETQIHKNPEA